MTDRRGKAMIIDTDVDNSLSGDARMWDDISKNGFRTQAGRDWYAARTTEMLAEMMEHVTGEKQHSSSKLRSATVGSLKYRNGTKLTPMSYGDNTHLHPQRKSKYPPVE